MAIEIDGVKYAWDQPMCDTDWAAKHPTRQPYRFGEAVRRTERCAWCGELTNSGIYVRQNPRDVAFPAREEEE